MIQNLEKITFGRKVVCDAGLVIGTRRYGWELRRNKRPLWAKSERLGAMVSIMNYRKGNIQLYIPLKDLKAGDVLTVQDCDKREKWTINAVCATAIDYDAKAAAVPERKRYPADYKTRAAEPEEIEPFGVLVRDGETDLLNPLYDTLDHDFLERVRRIDHLSILGFTRSALENLETTELDNLYEQFGR